MSNSTYCDDHYEQAWELKKIDKLEKQVKQMIEKACDAYCAVCDTKECGESCVECIWVKKFRKQLKKELED